MIAFPSDFLSTLPPLPPDKPIIWIPPAPSGGATVLEMLFTNESEEQVQQEFAAGNQRRIVDCISLPNSELFILASHFSDWTNHQVKVPQSNTHPSYLFSHLDPKHTGRPVRITMFNQPTDGEALIGRELGGYRTAFADGNPADNEIDTLTRQEVFEINRDRLKLKST